MNPFSEVPSPLQTPSFTNRLSIKQTKKAQRERNFKKDSIIYGIPIKKQQGNDLDISQMLSHDADIMKHHEKGGSRSFTDRIILDTEMRGVQIFVFLIIIFSLVQTLTCAYYACFGPPQNEVLATTEVIMEVFFALDILRYFLTQYVDPEEQKTVRNLKLIAKRYVKGGFIFDILSFSPQILRWLVRNSWAEDTADLLFLLRMLRLSKVVRLLDSQAFQVLLKKIYDRSLNTAIRDNPDVKPLKEDHNKIMQQIYIMYIFKVVQLVIFIVVLSYFLGTFVYLVTKHTTDLNAAEPEFTFYNYYELGTKSDYDNLIIVVYYAFTTLSTVGFGDFNPKSEIERIVTTVILLLGVACFSYIMGQFIDILLNIQQVTADNEDSENLSKWLGLLKHFNKNHPLPKEMTKRFETYFEYYWANDKNYAIKDEADQRFMSELP